MTETGTDAEPLDQQLARIADWLDGLTVQLTGLSAQLDAIAGRLDRFDAVMVELQPLLDKYTKNPAARFGAARRARKD